MKKKINNEPLPSRQLDFDRLNEARKLHRLSNGFDRFNFKYILPVNLQNPSHPYHNFAILQVEAGNAIWDKFVKTES